jgi:tetratricopeptide (TPR) repeat protein
MLDGCLHEVYADPRVQEVLDSFDARERGNFSMRSEVGELRLAADQFEEALKHAPAHPEARLRWGRTLGRLGRHQDAVVELRTARDRLDESMLKYYAELFVGAEEEAVGNLTTAERAYQNARSLFPMAQAPVLALSQLAHRRGERSEARRIIAEPLAAATTDEDDPWWTYDVSCGRRAEEIYDSVYQRVAELQPR